MRPLIHPSTTSAELESRGIIATAIILKSNPNAPSFPMPPGQILILCPDFLEPIWVARSLARTRHFPEPSSKSTSRSRRGFPLAIEMLPHFRAEERSITVILSQQGPLALWQESAPATVEVAPEGLALSYMAFHWHALVVLLDRFDTNYDRQDSSWIGVWWARYVVVACCG